MKPKVGEGIGTHIAICAQWSMTKKVMIQTSDKVIMRKKWKAQSLKWKGQGKTDLNE